MTRQTTRKATHPFVADPDLGADMNGRQVCARCRLVGQPDDAHHHLPEPVSDGRMRAAGERGDG